MYHPTLNDRGTSSCSDSISSSSDFISPHLITVELFDSDNEKLQDDQRSGETIPNRTLVKR